MHAYRIYKSVFQTLRLSELYQEKISASHAVGKDGVTQSLFAENLEREISLIKSKVENCTYEFTSYKQRLISKGAHKKPRVLSIPTIRDRLVLRALNSILVSSFPKAVSKRPHTYIKEITDYLDSIECNQYSFVRLDIQNFFPSINHSLLEVQIKRRIRKKQINQLISKAIKTSSTPEEKSQKGIPQGLSISSILSSINLLDFDELLSERYFYRRYVDDILLIVHSDKAETVFSTVNDELKEIGLEAHDLGTTGKSQVASLSNGIDYLGYQISTNNVIVRESSYKKMFENLLSVFTSFKHTPKSSRSEERLLWRLNLKITGCIFTEKRFGWIFFFSQITDLRQLGRLDDFVTSQLNKRGLSHMQNNVRTFIKSYHEIRFNLDETVYIPNFDTDSVEEMIDVLVNATGTTRTEFENMETEKIKKRHYNLIRRYTRRLELDLFDAFS